MDQNRIKKSKTCKLCGSEIHPNRWQTNMIYCNGCYLKARKIRKREWARKKFNIPKERIGIGLGMVGWIWEKIKKSDKIRVIFDYSFFICLILAEISRLSSIL